MARFEGNPIIEPVLDNEWESKYVFNPAMFSLNGRIHFIYRAMGWDNISRLGYASSKQGYNIDERLENPIFTPSTVKEKYGCEDPRVTIIGDKCFMTYTAYGDIPQIGITSISTRDLLAKKWNWGERIYPFPNTTNKNAVIFPRKFDGRFVMLHRIEPNIHIAFSEDLRNWQDSGILMGPRENSWDGLKIGSAGPPIEMDDSWLLIYHGVSEKKVYRLGAALLQKDLPAKVIYRTKNPFIEPDEDYECVGFVPNVVFSCGAVKQDDRVLISYGCADTVIGVSTFTLDEILYS
jgi:predicted GH43/DUF377 family glycosyl hydrolase